MNLLLSCLFLPPKKKPFFSRLKQKNLSQSWSHRMDPSTTIWTREPKRLDQFLVQVDFDTWEVFFCWKISYCQGIGQGCTPNPNVPLWEIPEYKPCIVGVYGLQSPRIPREHNKYRGYTVRGTPNCLLILLLAEILHHLGCMKPQKQWDFNYQPQLVSRNSAINSRWWLNQPSWKNSVKLDHFRRVLG